MTFWKLLRLLDDTFGYGHNLIRSAMITAVHDFCGGDFKREYTQEECNWIAERVSAMVLPRIVAQASHSKMPHGTESSTRAKEPKPISPFVLWGKGAPTTMSEQNSRTQYYVTVPSNPVTVIGRLAAAPEMRYTPNGQPVTSVRFAVSRRYQQGEEWKEKTAWMRASVWGENATRLNDRNLSAGDVVMVQFDGADLEAHAYTNTNDGKPAASLEITSARVKVIAYKNANGATPEAAPAAEEEIPF